VSHRLTPKGVGADRQVGSVLLGGAKAYHHRWRVEHMKKRGYSRLLAELAEEHKRRSPRSLALNETAKQHLVDGGSHNLRLMEPFPPRIVKAHGGWIRDEDGHDILDFWQGHLANVLGHNPEVVTSELSRAFGEGVGLQDGFVDRLCTR
jgi:4-aminobutyrate aminotransferase-like enzyme